MGIRRAVAVIAVGGVGLALSLGTAASPAAATTTARSAASTSGWQPVEYTSFTEPAGEVCSFALQVDPVRQDVKSLTVASYPDGSPKDQIFAGPLYERYTNVATGKSVVGNVSGTAYIHYDPDGTQRWYVVGPVGINFHVGNPYHAAGSFIIGGVTEFVFHGGTVPEVVAHAGPHKDLCATLG